MFWKEYYKDHLKNGELDLKITHHGAVSGVTGSCHQLHINSENSLLIDCGLFQGAEKSGRSNATQLEITFDISSVQALLLTHCHIDHVGRIPYLLAAGFTGPIIATEATVALLPLVIEDALKVGVTRNASIINACLKRLKSQLVAVPYKRWYSLNLSNSHILPNQTQSLTRTKIRFQPAGHILGSAYIEIDVIQENLKPQRVIFSGDLGAPYAPLLPTPKPPYKADILVIESTYGDKIHEARKHRSARLKKVLKKSIADNGVVIIPAFSVGRTQELLYELEHIIRQVDSSEKLASIEVIVDSPMAASFTDYYRDFKKLWDAEARSRVKSGRHPLSFDELYTVDTHEEHLETIDYLAKRKKPAIIIAASGMCSGGRVVNYLKRFLPEKTADVIFVGYQAAGTPGRDIQKYAQKSVHQCKNHGKQAPGYVILDGEKIDIMAGVHTLSGYSAHADQTDLVNFIKRMPFKPREVIVVHGDDKAKQALVACLKPFVELVRVGQDEQ